MRRLPPYIRLIARMGLAAGLAALVLSSLWPRRGGAVSEAREYEIKAAYIYHFISFVKWPDRGGQGSGDVVIGILGDDPFNNAFGPVENKPVPGSSRVLRVRRLGPWKEGMDLSSVQILFIAGSEQPHLAQVLSSLAGRPVLTVGDSERFLENGGMINLVMVNQRVRWEINRRPVGRAGLELSAQVLRLAIRVVDI
jgi:hypothetical protein